MPADCRVPAWLQCLRSSLFQGPTMFHASGREIAVQASLWSGPTVKPATCIGMAASKPKEHRGMDQERSGRVVSSFTRSLKFHWSRYWGGSGRMVTESEAGPAHPTRCGLERFGQYLLETASGTRPSGRFDFRTTEGRRLPCGLRALMRHKLRAPVEFRSRGRGRARLRKSVPTLSFEFFASLRA